MARTTAVPRTAAIDLASSGEILAANAAYGYDLVGLCLTSAATQEVTLTAVDPQDNTVNIVFQMVAGVPVVINLERGAILRVKTNEAIDCSNASAVSGFALYFNVT